MYKVSLIIPVYNVKQFLERCLKSVFSQTHALNEVICINDGSLDDSDDILCAYARKHPQIKIITQRNQGLSMARNASLKTITGELVCFLDSDDYYDSTFVEDLYNTLTQNDADVAMAGVRIINTNAITTIALPQTNFTSFLDKVKNLPNGGCWNKLYKTAFLKKYELTFPKGKYWEDNPFTVKTCFYCNKLATSNGGMYNYVTNPTGITCGKNKQPKRTQDSQAIAKEIMTFVEQKNCSEEELNAVSDFCFMTFLSLATYVCDRKFRAPLVKHIKRTPYFKKNSSPPSFEERFDFCYYTSAHPTI